MPAAAEAKIAGWNVQRLIYCILSVIRRQEDLNFMDEKKKLNPAGAVPESDPEQIIKGTEADTENIVDFMHEEIKKRPMNRRRLLRRARETTAIAILFGVVSCLVFAILLPVISNIINPGEKETTAVTLPEESVSEELTPEDMLENEREREETEEKRRIREELEGILDEKIGVEQQKRISTSLQELAADKSNMVVTVSRITSDTDWFNDPYENRDTCSGLVTAKTDTDIYILVQSRRIEDASRILVTFPGGVDAEAEVAGTDPSSGMAVLSVPSSSVPVGNRTEIQEAQFGASAASVITGAPVIAIGSPTGTPGSVIYGYVTGAGQSLDIMDNNLYRLTTDIYGSGDATGFLINLDGRVVGMIDMRHRDNNVPNMLCAVGITELRPVINRLEMGGKKAVLGIYGTDVTETISQENDIPIGIWVTRIEEDSPAMAAGIQKGDVITGFDKEKIAGMADLITQLSGTEPGQNATLVIQRRNGGEFEEMKIPVLTQ